MIVVVVPAGLMHKQAFNKLVTETLPVKSHLSLLCLDPSTNIKEQLDLNIQIQSVLVSLEKEKIALGGQGSKLFALVVGEGDA